MKVFTPIVLFAAVSAEEEKKVPPRHPLARLAKLNRFIGEWCNANLDAKAAAHWAAKFDRNSARLETRFELCPQYEQDATTHDQDGHKISRRDADEDDDEAFARYDKDDVIRGLKQITTGFRKYAERYVSGCKLQPDRTQARLAKWHAKLLLKHYQHISQ
jgi:hypothetical protein